MMNHKTRKLAKLIYDMWLDDVRCIAPPGSFIASFDQQRRHFMREALKVKKSLHYRQGNHELAGEA